MKAMLFSLVATVGLGLGTGCAGLGGSSNYLLDPAKHGDTCPACKTKYVLGKPNEKGRSDWVRVHVCPDCKMEVVTVKKDGRWCHECVHGPTQLDCKTCNPK